MSRALRCGPAHRDPLEPLDAAAAAWPHCAPGPCARCGRLAARTDPAGARRHGACGPPWPPEPIFCTPAELDAYQKALKQARIDRALSSGWRLAAGIPWWPRCAACGRGSYYLDPAGAPRHPWCALT